MLRTTAHVHKPFSRTKYTSPRVIKNRKPLILPLSKELTGMLKKLFHKDCPVFDTTNFRRVD